MKNYYYSAASNAFYPVTLRDDYERSGTWPTDGVPVDEDVFVNSRARQRLTERLVLSAPTACRLGAISHPVPEQVLADAMALRASLMAQATTAIAPLQDAADSKSQPLRSCSSCRHGRHIACSSIGSQAMQASRHRYLGPISRHDEDAATVLMLLHPDRPALAERAASMAKAAPPVHRRGKATILKRIYKMASPIVPGSAASVGWPIASSRTFRYISATSSRSLEEPLCSSFAPCRRRSRF